MSELTLFGRPRVHKDTAWAQGVVDKAKPLLQRRMDSWTPQERFAWARWHCLRFGNCTQDERRNRMRSSEVAKGLSTMAMSQEYGDLTGAQYAHYAKLVHQERGQVPWFDPFLVKAVIEWSKP